MKTTRPRQQKLPFALVAGLGGLVTLLNAPAAETWASTSAPQLIWNAVASSADGSTLLAASGTRPYARAGMPLFLSTNAGATWTMTQSPSNAWTAVATSADGTKLAAAAATRFPTAWFSFGDGLIYTSPDSGATWTPTPAPTNTWRSIASSADGTQLVAVARPYWFWDADNELPPIGDGVIVRSSDSGVTWTTASAPTNYWASVACSADGTRIVAVSGARWHSTLKANIGDGGIYRSSDSGVTWARTHAPTNQWTSVACSADGTQWVARAGDASANPNPPGLCADPGIYRSVDSGDTWSRTFGPNDEWVSVGWSSVTCSADGLRMAVSGYSVIYTSTDSGATWTPATTGASSALALASSADGYRVVAAGWNGLVTLPYSGPWRLVNAHDVDRPGEPLHWQGAATSSDGTRWVAVGTVSPYDKGGGRFYASHDSGLTWPPAGQFMFPWNWTSIASSADATRLFATLEYSSGYAGIVRSLDSGISWTQTSAPGEAYTSVASSSDGSKVVAAAPPRWDYQVQQWVSHGGIYASTDSGANWRLTSAPGDAWTAVASSADGSRLFAVSEYGTDGPDVGGSIYFSMDAGATWTRGRAPTNSSTSWTSIASSADGLRLVAVSKPEFYWQEDQPLVRGGGIYVSGDSGVTWRLTSAPTNETWMSVASSADGTRLAAVAGDRYFGTGSDSVYLSTDSGMTWARTSTPAGPWYRVACSADGQRIALFANQPNPNGRSICLLQSPAPEPLPPPSPRLTVSLSGADLNLSWLIPSTRFVLQHTAVLGSVGWVDVPTQPTLDLTNLHHRVTLTPSPGHRYFRLRQQ